MLVSQQWLIVPCWKMITWILYSWAWSSVLGEILRPVSYKLNGWYIWRLLLVVPKQCFGSLHNGYHDVECGMSNIWFPWSMRKCWMSYMWFFLIQWGLRNAWPLGISLLWERFCPKQPQRMILVIFGSSHTDEIIKHLHRKGGHSLVVPPWK